MLFQVLNLFGIDPDYNLDCMLPNQHLNHLASKIFSKFDQVLREFEPELVLVHGDTTSSTAASIASYYRGIKVAHVEAGLRSGDLSSPWPEEGNRLMTSKLASIHFAPTKQSQTNLLQENISSDTRSWQHRDRCSAFCTFNYFRRTFN